MKSRSLISWLQQHTDCQLNISETIDRLHWQIVRIRSSIKHAIRPEVDVAGQWKSGWIWIPDQISVHPSCHEYHDIQYIRVVNKGLNSQYSRPRSGPRTRTNIQILSMDNWTCQGQHPCFHPLCPERIKVKKEHAHGPTCRASFSWCNVLYAVPVQTGSKQVTIPL